MPLFDSHLISATESLICDRFCYNPSSTFPHVDCFILSVARPFPYSSLVFIFDDRWMNPIECMRIVFDAQISIYTMRLNFGVFFITEPTRWSIKPSNRKESDCAALQWTIVGILSSELRLYGQHRYARGIVAHYSAPLTAQTAPVTVKCRSDLNMFNLWWWNQPPVFTGLQCFWPSKASEEPELVLRAGGLLDYASLSCLITYADDGRGFRVFFTDSLINQRWRVPRIINL